METHEVNTTRAGNFLEDYSLFKALLSVNLVLAVVAIFGMLGNVLNLCNFYRQGFTITINISLFILATSDFVTCAFYFFSAISANPWHQYMHITNVSTLEAWLFSFWFASCISCVSGWAAVTIALERCLCIVFPLKIKQIITPKLLTIWFAALYSWTIGFSTTPFTSPWLVKLSGSNATIQDLIQPQYHRLHEEHSVTYSHVFFTLNVLIEFLPCVILPVLSFWMIYALRKATKWRGQFGTTPSGATERMSLRERRVLRVAIVVSVIYLLCMTPLMIMYFVSFFIPGLILGASYEREYVFFSSMAALFSTVNSSINIVIYYKLSTSYKDTLDGLFKMCCVFSQWNPATSRDSGT